MKGLMLERTCILVTLVFLLGFLGYYQTEEQDDSRWEVASGLSEDFTGNPQETGVETPQEEILAPPRDLEVDPICLNTATQEELELLPGIGETRAKEILVYRQEVGEFLRLEDIMEVSGIGEGIFAEIQPLITLDNQGEGELFTMSEGPPEILPEETPEISHS